MKLFPVEFSEISDLLTRYLRSMKIAKMNDTINEKLAVERRITRMMSTFNNDFQPNVQRNNKLSKSFRSPISSMIRKVKMKKKLQKNRYSRMFNSIMSPRPEMNNSI